MLIIGLTGSIGMGKSEAARIMGEYGLPVFDADTEVHRLYDSPKGAELIRPIVPEATRENKVDRKALSAAVLKDPALLSALEQKVHAEIRLRRSAFIARAKAQGAKAVVLDIPLLFETGADKEADKTLVISSNSELQHKRVLARHGMTKERFDMILARQMPDESKRSKADAVIFNNSTLVELKKSLHAQLAVWGI